MKTEITRVEVTRKEDGPDFLVLWIKGRDGREYDFDQTVPRGGAEAYLHGLGVDTFRLKVHGSKTVRGRSRPTIEESDVSIDTPPAN